MVKVEAAASRGAGSIMFPCSGGRVFSPRSEPGLRETGGASGVRRLVIPAFALNGVFELGVKLSALQKHFRGRRRADGRAWRESSPIRVRLLNLPGAWRRARRLLGGLACRPEAFRRRRVNDPAGASGGRKG
ncbi:MAG: hypothetical protein MZV70_43295 [Desulfobacterales bacterium]|nr:hypothetical protein [Desulfobacterales bacterium]